MASRDAAKLALKAAVRPWLPDALIDRRKQGFAMPLPEWLGGESTIASTVLGADVSAPVSELLDVDRIAALGARHAAGAGNFTAIVHSAFVLDRWFTQWHSH